MVTPGSDVDCAGANCRFGFLDVAWGFISDVDFDSEVFRWMGKARFTVTAIEKLVSNDSYRARISFILADFVQQPCVQIHCPVCASAAHARQLNEMLSIAGSGTAVEPEKLFQGLADESDGDPTDEDDYDGSKSGSDGQQTRLLVSDEEKFDEEEEVGPGLRYIGRRAAKANWKVIEDNFSLFVASNVRGISTDTFLTPYAHLSGTRPRLDACTHLFPLAHLFLSLAVCLRVSQMAAWMSASCDPHLVPTSPRCCSTTKRAMALISVSRVRTRFILYLCANNVTSH